MRTPLESLIEMEITSAAKKPQKLMNVASAIYIITADDIKRSTATVLPELLMGVPGMHVVQINAHSWAISARGFNGLFSRDLLILMDGRSLYTPLFSGVYWDTQDLPLEDIERIEIIRGPGGTLWGANAVNGVINILTKKANETKGSLVTVVAGTQERVTTYRYGDQTDSGTAWRVWGKGIDQDPFSRTDGWQAHDSWQRAQGGFRLDKTFSSQDEWSLQGDIYDGNLDQKSTVTSLLAPYNSTLKETNSVWGANLLSHWKRILSSHSDMDFLVYYDHTYRSLDETRDTLDLGFQHRFPLSDHQEITWGMGYRLSHGEYPFDSTTSMDPDSRTDNLLSTFVQDEIQLIPNQVKLILGTKIEHNDYTGLELQPNARVLWRMAEDQTLWTSVSRAVRTPSWSNHNFRINVTAFPMGPPFNVGEISIFGSEAVQSEELMAYELGYRKQFGKNFFLDTTAFYHVYDDLVSNENGTPFVEADAISTHLVTPIYWENKLQAHTYGLELDTQWQTSESLRLQLGASLQKIDLDLKEGSTDTSSLASAGDDPQFQFHLHSYWDIIEHVQLDTMLYYVQRLSSLNIPAFWRADIRLGWEVQKNCRLDLIGINLLDDSTPQFIDAAGATENSEFPRSFLAKLTWSF
ncbi:MAG: TonB-dependent receptor [Magnetococcus sp. DMHC-6]